MNLQQLHYLVATADTGTMTAAAKQSHVAQPALSRAIKALEGELGVEIFQRDGRGVRLTETGKEIVEGARLVLDDVNRLLATARSHQGARDPLVIATTPTLEPFVSRHFLVELYSRHPGAAARVLRST